MAETRSGLGRSLRLAPGPEGDTPKKTDKEFWKIGADSLTVKLPKLMTR
jgi:hypothetical protein